MTSQLKKKNHHPIIWFHIIFFSDNKIRSNTPYPNPLKPSKPKYSTLEIGEPPQPIGTNQRPQVDCLLHNPI
jgi:hypothetical protein